MRCRAGAAVCRRCGNWFSVTAVTHFGPPARSKARWLAGKWACVRMPVICELRNVASWHTWVVLGGRCRWLNATCAASAKLSSSRTPGSRRGNLVVHRLAWLGVQLTPLLPLACSPRAAAGRACAPRPSKTRGAKHGGCRAQRFSGFGVAPCGRWCADGRSVLSCRAQAHACTAQAGHAHRSGSARPGGECGRFVRWMRAERKRAVAPRL